MTTADWYIATARRQIVLRRSAFLVFVVGPTLAAALYFGLMATPRYASEAQFVVRSASSTGRISGLDALFRTIGIARAVDDANIVQKFMLSRDAVIALDEKGFLREVFSREEGDRFSRFPRPWESSSFEDLYSHYLSRVKVIHDSGRGITMLRTQAFRAEDSKQLAEKLLALAETMANRINARALSDAIAVADTEVRRAEQRLIDAQLALTEFRNESVLVDPSRTSTSTLETISALSNDLTQTQAQIQEISKTAANSPALSSLRARADALRARIDTERAKLAGSSEALAAKVSVYERLALSRDLADKALASSLLSLENARQEALRQRIYVEQVSAPNLPDEAHEPERLRMVATVFLICGMGFAVFWLLSVGAKEHAQ